MSRLSVMDCLTVAFGIVVELIANVVYGFMSQAAIRSVSIPSI